MLEIGWIHDTLPYFARASSSTRSMRSRVSERDHPMRGELEETVSPISLAPPLVLKDTADFKLAWLVAELLEVTPVRNVTSLSTSVAPEEKKRVDFFFFLCCCCCCC